jgi:UPF0176 protein
MNNQLYNKKGKKDLEKNLSNEMFKRVTLSFYKYVGLGELVDFRARLYRDFIDLDVLGRVYISEEGINAQISIPEDRYSNFTQYIYTYKEFKNIQIKMAIQEGNSFYKLTVKVKNEIVAYNINKNSYDMNKVGKHLNPIEFNKELSNPDSITVDMRNHYESEVGHFKNAIIPDIDRSQDLLKEVKKLLNGKEEKKILLYCTGGIRCEKASSFLIKNDFKDVNQLKGGIINYSHEIKKNKIKSQFIGKNFVFDARMGERITSDIISHCHQCNHASDSHTNCANDLCHLLFIQCKQCNEKFKGCCCIECLDYYNLDEKNKKKKKEEFLDFNNKRLQGKVKPKLYDILN